MVCTTRPKSATLVLVSASGHSQRVKEIGDDSELEPAVEQAIGAGSAHLASTNPDRLTHTLADVEAGRAMVVVSVRLDEPPTVVAQLQPIPSGTIEPLFALVGTEQTKH